MSWAASTLYLPDTPDARAVLLADPALAGHAFALDLAALRMPPRLATGATGRILAVRSPVRKADIGLVGHGFDWSALDGTLAPRLAALRPELRGDTARIAPPDARLRWLEDLAARTCGTVCWYQAEAEHGDPEGELASVIDAGGPATLHFGSTPIDVDRAPTLYARNERRFRRIGSDAPARDPLAMALLHLGALLDGPWFEPHAPHFDWEACRIA